MYLQMLRRYGHFYTVCGYKPGHFIFDMPITYRDIPRIIACAVGFKRVLLSIYRCIPWSGFAGFKYGCGSAFNSIA
jgi:hypothetical protein